MQGASKGVGVLIAAGGAWRWSGVPGGSCDGLGWQMTELRVHIAARRGGHRSTRGLRLEPLLSHLLEVSSTRATAAATISAGVSVSKDIW